MIKSSLESSPLHESMWAAKSTHAKRDLVIKKIVISLIALLNFAAIATAVYFIIAYCSIPTQALLISPFVVGVLAALSQLKFPTLGVSSSNYTHFSNPANLMGRGLAYIFFGPLLYAINKMDWTPYHDPFHANKISTDLKELLFEKIAPTYGSHFSHLIKYGFIDQKYSNDLISLYDRFKPLNEEINFWKAEGLINNPKALEAQRKMDLLSGEYNNLKNEFEDDLPAPEMPVYDFSQKKTLIKLKARSACCFGAPIELIRKVHI